MGEDSRGAYIRAKESEERPKQGEVERWLGREKVFVDMESDAFRDRLAELRERSKDVNSELNLELNRRGLPFSTQRTHDKAVRIVIELRPEFFQTDEDDEAAREDRATKRYAVQDDQVTVFLHMRQDGSLDFPPRFRSELSGPRYELFISELFTRQERAGRRRQRRSVDGELSEILQSGDSAETARLVADLLGGTVDAHAFSGAERIHSLDDARNFFSDTILFCLRDASIVRNISRIALRSLLESRMSQPSSVLAGTERFIEVAQDANTIAQQFLDIPVNVMDTTGKVHTVREYIAHNKGNNSDDAVYSIVTDVLKRHKARIYGWTREDEQV